MFLQAHRLEHTCLKLSDLLEYEPKLSILNWNVKGQCSGRIAQLLQATTRVAIASPQDYPSEQCLRERPETLNPK